MAHLDVGPPKKEYSPKALHLVHQLIMTAVNNLDKTNFRKRVKGNDIIDPYSLSINRLAWREFIFPLVMAAPFYQTASTTPQNIGGYFPWDPARFPGPGTWYFEADIAISNTASITTCQLRGTDVLRAVTTQQTGLVRVRSSAVSMPATTQNLWVQAFSNNASHTATVAGAKLIFEPL